MRQAADAMVSTGMIDHGYAYVNIDDCLGGQAGIGGPDARRPPRRPGEHQPQQAIPRHEGHDRLHPRQGAEGRPLHVARPADLLRRHGRLPARRARRPPLRRVGIRFSELDWCSYFGNVAKNPGRLPRLQKPYRQMGEILKKLDRDVVFNFCQYGMGKTYGRGGAEAGGQSWRIADDFGGDYENPWLAVSRFVFRSLRPQRIAEVQRPRRLERSRLHVAGLSAQLEKRQGRTDAADAQRTVYARVALVPGGRSVDLQRRHDAARRFHAQPVDQRRGDRSGPGPAGQGGLAGGEGRRSRSLGQRHGGRQQGRGAVQPRPARGPGDRQMVGPGRGRQTDRPRRLASERPGRVRGPFLRRCGPARRRPCPAPTGVGGNRPLRQPAVHLASYIHGCRRGGGDSHAQAAGDAADQRGQVFGVRPGHPFLFTIPATGQRPMEFAVDVCRRVESRSADRPDHRLDRIAASTWSRFRAKNAWARPGGSSRSSAATPWP